MIGYKECKVDGNGVQKYKDLRSKIQKTDHLHSVIDWNQVLEHKPMGSCARKSLRLRV
jgi:hypothetical protein